MNRVKVITDSCADLSADLVKKFDLDVVPMYVQIEGKSYLDGIEMTTEELYRLVEKSNTLPKTAAPSSGDFYERFSKWINAGYDVIYVGLSSKLSAAYQAARIAAEEFDENRLKLVDTHSLSTGIGLLTLKAAEMAQEGKGLEEIYQKVSALVPKVRVSFMIDTLKYLHMGGRCSSIQLLASNVLKIRPQIIVKDGGMIVGAKFRGKRASCLNQFYEEAVGDGSQINRQRVFVTHSACSPEECMDFKRRLEELGISEVYITQAGTVISSHCGPGTIGILYIED
ncbi:MAG: DegV family protein [Clostridiales bacterium]|jgi:DegV family protein with EDD domain|nr:DegV family protein [Clostridiales bacterium]